MDTHERDARRRQRRLLDAGAQEQRRQEVAAWRLAVSEEQRWHDDLVYAFMRSRAQLLARWRWN
jgi:hypothetical protein